MHMTKCKEEKFKLEMVADSLIPALWRQMQVDLYKLRSAWFILGVSNQIGIQSGISP